MSQLKQLFYKIRGYTYKNPPPGEYKPHPPGLQVPAAAKNTLPSTWDYCPAPKWSHLESSSLLRLSSALNFVQKGLRIQGAFYKLSYNSRHLITTVLSTYSLCSAKPFTITHFSKAQHLSHTQVTAVCLVPKPVLNHYVMPLRDVTQLQLKGSKALPH